VLDFAEDCQRLSAPVDNFVESGPVKLGKAKQIKASAGIGPKRVQKKLQSNQ